ncbi:hypothetical protein T492DRAFT_1128060 [Pavlovales sp. CCMP2436]|nr:hypothetical protein T492DRAFT_1128060 [Pavlovales sp. CCMP2436]
MDEATAAVDSDTDRLIQTSLREAFKDATVLTIAHRLHTVIDSNKVMLLSQGALLEFGEPHALLADEHSAFSQVRPAHFTRARAHAHARVHTHTHYKHTMHTSQERKHFPMKRLCAR